MSFSTLAKDLLQTSTANTIQRLSIQSQNPAELIKRERLSRINLLAIAIVPGLCALTPVLLPFGDAYAHSDNWTANLKENWSYFFWYNTTGWSFLWLTLSIWTNLLLPELKLGLLPIIVPTIFSVVIFAILAKFVFPIPLGTFSIGVPCFVCEFACLFLGADKEARWNKMEGTGTILDRLPGSKLLLVCVFYTVWVSVLLLFAFLTALMQDAGLLVQLVIMCSFPVIRDATSRPSMNFLLRWLKMINPETGKFFYSWFELSHDTYLLFLFPLIKSWLLFSFVVLGDVVYEVSLVTVSQFNPTEKKHVQLARSIPGVQTIYFTYLAFRHMLGKDTATNAVFPNAVFPKQDSGDTAAEDEAVVERKVAHIEWLVQHHFCEIFSFAPFIMVFLYNIYGPNFGQMYIFDKFTDNGMVRMMLLKMAISFVAKLVTGVVLLTTHMSLLKKEKSSRVVTGAHRVMAQLVNSFHLPMIVCIASITTVAGCCMTMKHDGMDMTLKFVWLGAGGANMTST